jgi:sec-independent protein translocase protein TatA
MFGLGTSELLIILVIVLVIFGAGKLPSVGKSLGEGIRGFKEGMKDKETASTDEPKIEEKKKDA